MRNVTLEARFEIIAPMFAGGEKVASGRTEAEIRPTAIKGALRFWWRTLAWGRLGGDLERLKREEDALFGAAADTDRTDRTGPRGQAAFLLRLLDVETRPFGGHGLRNGAAYLGYGPIDREKVVRQAFDQGSMFSVALLCRPRCSDEQRKQLKQAIIAFGLLGGMGARSRRGFGSVRLLSLTIGDQEAFKAPDDKTAYIEAIRGLVGPLRQRRPKEQRKSQAETKPEDEPGWTAFSGGPPKPDNGSNELRGTVCAILEPGDKKPAKPTEHNGNDPSLRALSSAFASESSTALGVLDMLGTGMLLYRGWGRNGKIAAGGLPAWKQFKDDHDWFKGTLKHPEHFHPERISFGLPHNYYSGDGRKAKVEPRPSNHCGDRRSSPLLFHVHRLGSKFIGVATIFPGILLPKDAKLGLEHSKEDYDDVSPSANYGVLFDMIDGDGQHGRRQSPFEARMILKGWGTAAHSGKDGGDDD